MKKLLVLFIVVAMALCVTAGCAYTGGTEKKEYLRIHIRANSNSQTDQAVKYSVKEAVVEFLTPYIADLRSKEEAVRFLRDNMKKIEKIADNVLKEEGFDYASKGEVANEKFPTRTYEKLTLEGGYYDALILRLGEGTGDNWWCVVYPPLCFVGSGSNYVYKSKIKEIIDNFYKIKG